MTMTATVNSDCSVDYTAYISDIYDFDHNSWLQTRFAALENTVMLLLLTWEEIFLEHIESIKNDERNIVYCFDFIDKFYLVHILSCVHREIPVGKNTCMFFNWFYCHNIMERGWIFLQHIIYVIFVQSFSEVDLQDLLST